MRRRSRPHTRRSLTLLVLAALVAGGLWGGAALWRRSAGPASPPEAGAGPAAPQAVGPAPAAPGPFDLVISGGLVYDGTGAAPRRADVGIRGDRIVAVGDLRQAVTTRRLHADGMAVAPGFIDVHSHTYEYDDPFTLAAVMQGVTTQIGGVDGRHHGYASGGQTPRPHQIAAALADIEQRGTGVNQALFAGLGTIWADVRGYNAGPATPAQMEQMQGLLQEAMAQGALGLSSGLDYEPDKQVSAAEITELARVAAAAGGIYVSHVRGDYTHVATGVAEALQIGREAGIPVGIQHFKFVGLSEWPQFEPVVAILTAAVQAGQRISIDVYPYQAPDFATHNPVDQALARIGGVAERVEIDFAPADPALVGLTLSEAAQRRGTEPADLARRLAATGARATPLLIRTEHMLALLKLDFALTDTDGEAAPRLDPEQAFLNRVHPRSYGSYPRFLRLNREHAAMPLETLIRKMTGAAADFYHLQDRGYLRPGAYADVVVFDPLTVAERATFSAPQEYPVGIRHVLVNGAVAVADGTAQGIKAGRALRRGL